MIRVLDISSWEGKFARNVTRLDLAPRARFELATLRLTADVVKILSALSGVAYREFGAILPSLVAPDPAPNTYSLGGDERIRREAGH